MRKTTDKKEATLTEVSKVETKSATQEAQDDMMATLVESVLPIVQPLMKPAVKKFSDFMNDGNIIIIRSVKGEVNGFHFKTSDVTKIELKPDAKPVDVYNMEEIVQNILSGKFSK